MTHFRKSLSSYVPWNEQLANLLDLPYNGPTLPARMTCPLCQGQRLSVYDDETSSGNWFCCADCGAAGDMIELAAAAWSMKPDTALQKLYRFGFPISERAIEEESVQSYLSHHLGYRERLKALWHQARDFLTQAPTETVARLRNLYRLHSEMSLERWRMGPGQLVGAAPTVNIEGTFVPGRLQHGDGPEDWNLVGKRVFQGRGWDDVLMIPFYDLPGRISAFSFVGRQGGAAGDQIFHPLERLQGQSKKRSLLEAGLAWLPELCRRCQDRVFLAIDDPWLALRMHIRHFNVSMVPLPLTAWHDGPTARTTRKAWKMLEGRPVVIWSWALDHRAVYQAIQADGLIAVAGPDQVTDASLSQYLRRMSPDDLRRLVLKRARPWREALAEWAEDKRDGAIEDLLLNLENNGVDVEDLCRSCPSLRRGRWCAPERLPERSVALGNRRFVERSDGWYHCTRDGKFIKILDAILRIERVDPSASEQGCIYHGAIIYQGETIPFAVAVGRRYRLARAVKDFLLRKGKGRLMQVLPHLRFP
jgi:hypothetical protein